MAWYDGLPGPAHMEVARAGRPRAGVRRARLAAARRPRPGAPALGHPRPARQSTQHPPVPATATTRSPTTAPIHPQERLGEMLPPEWERQAGRHHRQRAVLPAPDVAAGRAGRRHDRGDRRHDRRHIPALHDRQPERDPAGARRAVRDLVLRPVHGPGRPVAGARARRGPGRGRRLLRPGLPAHRRRGPGGELRLADARLDAAALSPCPRRRPPHPRHVGPPHLTPKPTTLIPNGPWRLSGPARKTTRSPGRPAAGARPAARD